MRVPVAVPVLVPDPVAVLVEVLVLVPVGAHSKVVILQTSPGAQSLFEQQFQVQVQLPSTSIEYGLLQVPVPVPVLVPLPVPVPVLVPVLVPVAVPVLVPVDVPVRVAVPLGDAIAIIIDESVVIDCAAVVVANLLCNT